ncbi:hypothetical protein MMC17_003367 [Xylographa soralifera]|nr:hypothetical protein [Xylographa soralifera]
MSSRDESDVPEVPSHALHDLLADLNTPSSSTLTPLASTQTSSWSFPSLTSRTSPPPYGSGPAGLLPRRTSSREHTTSATALDLASSVPSGHTPQTLFNTPTRSILSSGPPTSSVSASTAQASMSAPIPNNSPHSLASLTSPHSSASRRPALYHPDTQSSSSRKVRLSRAEKDVDDPSISMEDPRITERGIHTPTTLTKLFTTPEVPSPSVSRHASYIRTSGGTKYTRASSETAPLPDHLYTRGLLSGKHSDITIYAFGTRYPLHRLLLDRSPFFSTALSEPWFESSAKEITLHPEDIDANITQSAFEIALKHIYGCSYAEEEEKEAVGLFATANWLEMADLMESSIMSLLRQMNPAKLAPMIRLVTSNYYGKAGDRVLGSAKSMLCREGWEMPLRFWDGISGDIVREIVGGDGFYVPGEWDRWVLAKRILDRRLKSRAIEAGLVDANRQVIRASPTSMNFLAIRFDTVYRKTSAFGGRGVPEVHDPWLALYTCPDIAALLVLLDEGIHYVHLSFEHLQRIREQRDALGLPLMPEKVISNALWMSMELRQKIVNAKESEMEDLSLSQPAEEESVEIPVQADGPVHTLDPTNTSNVVSSRAAGKQPQSTSGDNEEEEMESGSWDGNGKPRKFWIPHVDATYPMGGNADAILAANGGRPSSAAANRHISRLSTSLDPQDLQWAADFASTAQERPQTPHRSVATEPSPPVSYTLYPPFRFSAEFPNPRSLKEKKRVYSSTVWYAGSLWNVYVQKIETSKNTQLGVYLHRERHREGSEDYIANMLHNSVDERIGHLEREMLMRRSTARNRQQQNNTRSYAEEETSGSGGDPDATLVAGTSAEADLRRQSTALSGLLRNHGQGIMKASETPATLTLSSLPDRQFGIDPDTDDESTDLTRPSKKYKVPTLPPYVDARPTIKTYFKIYTPSKGGRMLSVYESAPDQFNFSQSWGWKSSNMVLDDGIIGHEEGSRSKDGRLRFMIVIGNV